VSRAATSTFAFAAISAASMRGSLGGGCCSSFFLLLLGVLEALRVDLVALQVLDHPLARADAEGRVLGELGPIAAMAMFCASRSKRADEPFASITTSRFIFGIVTVEQHPLVVALHVRLGDAVVEELRHAAFHHAGVVLQQAAAFGGLLGHALLALLLDRHRGDLVGHLDGELARCSSTLPAGSRC
jgi:hypothetical protein